MQVMSGNARAAKSTKATSNGLNVEHECLCSGHQLLCFMPLNDDYNADISYHPSLALRLLNISQVQPGQKVLDLACGTGLFALSAAAAVAPNGHVIGVDISPAMLQQAEAKAAAGNLSTVTQFICGDIEELQDSLPADLLGTFDLAACSAAIPFLTQPHKTLEAWRCWLKPAARLVLNAFEPPGLPGHEIFQQVARDQYGVKGVFDPSAALGSPDLVTAALEAAGYTNIQASATASLHHMLPVSPCEHIISHTGYWHDRMAVSIGCENTLKLFYQSPDVGKQASRLDHQCCTSMAQLRFDTQFSEFG